MIAASTEVDAFIAELPEDRRDWIGQIRDWVRTHADPTLQECMSYRMIGYVVPLDLFPDGYHCNPGEPLPFLNIGSMKQHIGLYHMGLYSAPELLDQFSQSYRELIGKKPNMGKSCLRLPLNTPVPEELIRRWSQSMSTERWITTYSASRPNN